MGIVNQPVGLSMNRILLALPFVLAFGGGTALADAARCTVPQDQRQPETALRQKLEAEGWTVKRIKIEDGCYEVYALDAKRNRVEGYFDPGTLAPVTAKKED